MKPAIITLAILAAILAIPIAAASQIDEICADVGVTPGLDSPFAHVPYVYGRITLKSFDPAARSPKITAIFSDGQQTDNRYSVGRSGNYCFKRSGGSATIVVEIDGIEAARRTLTSFGSSQQREDFEIEATSSQRSMPATIISSKFARPANEKTAELYKNAAAADQTKDFAAEVKLLKEIVSVDPADFIAWAKLGTLYVAQNSFAEADAAFRKCLELRVDYTPAWINVGQLRVAQKQFEAAIEIFKYAVSLEPTSAKIFRLLGEAYLQARQGTLGAQALNEAIKLDPIGMAECHLTLAHLYELAGANKLATHEYKAFLSKMPDHPDKKKFEKFIKENPE